MKSTNDAQIILGLSLIRISIVATILLALASVVAPILLKLLVLGSLAYLAGQVLCLLGTGNVGKTLISIALGTLACGFVFGLVAEKATMTFIELFGLAGLVLVGLAGPLVQCSSMIALLLYLATLSEYYNASDLGSHFRRLIAVLVVMLFLPLGGALLMPQQMMVTGIATGVVALMFILSFSGSLARLIKAAQAETQA